MVPSPTLTSLRSYLDMQMLQTRSVWKQWQVRAGLTVEVRGRLLAGNGFRGGGGGVTRLVTRSSVLPGFTS